MDILRNWLLFVAFLAAMTPAVYGAEADKTWPVRTVRVIVPFPAGMTPDTAARLFAA